MKGPATVTSLATDALDLFLDRLESDYRNGPSGSELLQVTVSVAAETLEADVCLIAEMENGGLEPVESQPTDWTDTDGLLAPASLPSIIASRRISYLIADRSDVRGATESASPPDVTSRTIKSVLIVPYGDEKVLIVGNSQTSTYTDADLELLRLLSGVATAISAHLAPRSVDTQPPDRLKEAASTLSHDGTNFLTIIQGRVELARETPQPEHFDAIDRATQRLADLIEDTKTLLETGSQAMDPEPVQLREVVQETWELEQTEGTELWISPLDTIVAERSRLCQLFENLFRNAVTHAGPDVTVKVGMLSPTQGFFVEDDGPGIEPEERDSVFDFAYAEGEESHLGLPIVQWIAEAHGWDISVSGGDMGGARFEFSGVELVQ